MRKSKYFIIIIIIVIIASGMMVGNKYTAWSREQQIKNDVDKIIADEIKNYKGNKFNGIIVIAKNGKQIYEYKAGYANYEKKEMIDKDTAFNIGSISKQFTATAIMMLYEQGKLDINDKICRYIPELSYKDVTIKQLLTHTSGIADTDTDELLYKHWKDTSRIMSNEDVIKMLKEYNPPLHFKPGEKFEYCNMGYQLLSTIVQRVSGDEFDAFLHKNIFEPLDMKNTLVYSAIKNPKVNKRAYGYYSSSGYSYCDSDFYWGISGASCVYSTAVDLLKWDKALRDGKLLKKSSYDEMFKQQVYMSEEDKLANCGYGYGWVVKIDGNTKRVWHIGQDKAFESLIIRGLNNNYTLIYMTNIGSKHYFSVVEDISHTIFQPK